MCGPQASDPFSEWGADFSKALQFAVLIVATFEVNNNLLVLGESSDN